MISNSRVIRYVTQYRAASVIGYCAVVIASAAIALVALADIQSRFRDLDESRDLLARLTARKIGSAGAGRSASARPAGSPFLEGPTVTVASASLLQRARNAIVGVGGTLLSSEVDGQSLTKDGNIRIIATSELDPIALQQLLYELEAGMPFLFVDHLVVQPAAPDGKNGRMRVSLGLSGQWRANK